MKMMKMNKKQKPFRLNPFIAKVLDPNRDERSVIVEFCPCGCHLSMNQDNEHQVLCMSCNCAHAEQSYSVKFKND